MGRAEAALSSFPLGDVRPDRPLLSTPTIRLYVPLFCANGRVDPETVRVYARCSRCTLRRIRTCSPISPAGPIEPDAFLKRWYGCLRVFAAGTPHDEGHVCVYGVDMRREPGLVGKRRRAFGTTRARPSRAVGPRDRLQQVVNDRLMTRTTAPSLELTCFATPRINSTRAAA
jgi:hypothetical protein